MERSQPQPREIPLFRTVQQQAIADLLKTLPIPITITQHLIEGEEIFSYRYQVGETTPENPVGLCMGATPDFLQAVQLSLKMAMQQDGQEPRRGQKATYQAPFLTEDWIVPEVENGACDANQAAALGLPYRHRLTGETIAEWTERTLHDHPDGISQERNTGEEEEAELIYVLRSLPISVNIWKRPDGYAWQCNEQSGISEDFTTSVDNGLHSLLEQLIQHQESSREQYRSFGDILHQTGSYTERVITETHGARVVVFEEYGVIKLFRVEWTEPDGEEDHKAVYTLGDAMDAFQAVVHPEQEG